MTQYKVRDIKRIKIICIMAQMVYARSIPDKNIPNMNIVYHQTVEPQINILSSPHFSILSIIPKLH